VDALYVARCFAEGHIPTADAPGGLFFAHQCCRVERAGAVDCRIANNMLKLDLRFDKGIAAIIAVTRLDAALIPSCSLEIHDNA